MLVALVGVLVVPPLAGTASAATSVSFTSTLGAKWRAYLKTRPGSVSVAIYDRNTGKTLYVTDNITPRGWEMASTVKLDILALMLSKTGSSGKLTPAQYNVAKPMISVSDNAAASTLWNQVGGKNGMDMFFRKLGMWASNGGAGGKWGLTTTTAYDQLKLLRAVSYPGTLSANARATASALLDTVISSQRWGLTAGVPSGASVQLKNGWLPYDGGWVINSLAHVHGKGKDYVMAVYTRNSATMNTGIETIAGLSRLAWATVPAA